MDMTKLSYKLATLLLTFLSLHTFADTINPVIDNYNADKTDSCWVVEVQILSVFTDTTSATDDSSSLGNGLTLVANPATSNGLADVDTRYSGTISVTYTATDASGNVSTQCIHYVIKDYIAPVIDLKTDSVVTHCVGSTYTPVQATVTDNIYSASEISLTVTSAVDGYTIGLYQDTYKATDAAGNISIKVRTVNVIDCTNAHLDDIDINASYSVFPNPSSRSLNIKSINDTPIESIEITNNLGQQVYYQKINSYSAKINVSSYTTGTYTISIASNGQSSKKLIIVQ